MAEQLGAAQPIYDVAKAAYEKVSGFLGDPSKRVSRPDVMKSIPDDNANKKAWQEATKYRAKPTSARKVTAPSKPPTSKKSVSGSRKYISTKR